MIDYSALASDYARYRRVHPGVHKNLLLGGEVDEASKVLEVGCGTGNYAIALQEASRCTCWGTDPSEAMLDRARERSAYIMFQIGRAEMLDFPSDTFSLVFSVDAIHHVEDPPAYFREAYRVLKPGGKLCTVTDSECIIRNRIPMSSYFPETIDVDLERYPRIATLCEWMRQAGFDGIRDDVVELEYELTDIRAYRDMAYSALLCISEAAFQRGIFRLENDLRRGPIRAVSRYLLLWADVRQTSRKGTGTGD